MNRKSAVKGGKSAGEGISFPGMDGCQYGEINELLQIEARVEQ